MKKEINIPSNLSQMKLSDYMTLLQINKRYADDTQAMNDAFVQHYLLEGQDVKDLKASDYNTILTNVVACLREEPTDLIMTFTLGGKAYGFIPKLDDISVGEYHDIDTMLGDHYEYLHQIMSVLFRPITRIKRKGWFGKKYGYDIEKYETSLKYSEELKDMPANIAQNALVFFYTLAKELCHISLGYSQTLLMSNKMKSSEQKQSLIMTIDTIKDLLQQLEKTTLNSTQFKTLK